MKCRRSVDDMKVSKGAAASILKSDGVSSTLNKEAESYSETSVPN